MSQQVHFIRPTAKAAPPRVKDMVWPEGGEECLGYCPVCFEKKRDILHEDLEDITFGNAPGQWTMFRCSKCGVGYLDPRPNQQTIGLAYKKYYTHQAIVPTNSQFQNLKLAMTNGYLNMRFGAEFSPSNMLGILYYLFPARKKSLDSERRGLQQIHGDKTARVLDVGCGNGKFLTFAKMMGWQAFGVEPDPLAANTAKEAGIKIVGAFIDDVPEEYNKYFDIITLKHVIEHVHDPKAVIERCHLLLKDGGRLWIETPNIDSYGHQRYGRYWRGLEAPRHLIIFNWDGLYGLYEKSEFNNIKRELLHPVCKWMFTQSSLRVGNNGKQNEPIGTIKFRLIVFWFNMLERIDPTKHELICLTLCK